MRILKLFLLLAVFFSAFAFSQEDKKISEKQNDLSKLRNEITKLEEQLQDVNIQELDNLKFLENISKQELLLNKMINKLSNEERNKEQQINKTVNKISECEKNIEELRGKYSDYVVWLYKQKDAGILNLLFGSESINQALQRYRYLKFITEKNERALNNILLNKERLSELKNNLSNEKEEKAKLADEKTKDLSGIKITRANKQNLLKKLKSDEKYISSEIDKKRIAEIEIKNVIDKLIEEKRRKEIELQTKRLTNENLATPPEMDYNSLSSFVSQKGLLKWPVRGGRIVRGFGENVNEKLKTVTVNYGIDISMPDTSSVFPVEEGIVSAIDWIPGYGSVVIITHKEDFRTVYGHISNIVVNEGDKVTPKNPIGRINTSLEGNVLHFEIWNERNYQNPLEWLGRR